MDERELITPEISQTDIFLCTRELPDKLTAETAALRQLCSALAGEGYRVFFPSALPKELTDQEKAEQMVAALKSTRVMVAAGVGREGLDDPVSQRLWNAFLSGSEDAADRFILCWRDQGEDPLPEALSGMTPMDMSDLRFLFDLKERLAAVLPKPEEKAPPQEPVPEEEPPTEEPIPEEETPPEPAPEPAAEKKPFPWKWIIGAAVVLAVILWLIFRK